MTIPRVLHVEASTSYGGSVRALQTYLANCGQDAFIHDVLLYQVNGSEAILAPLVSRLLVLDRKAANNQKTDQGPNRLKRAVRRLLPDFVVSALSEGLAFAKSIPICIRLFRFLRKSDYALIHVNNTFSHQPATMIAARLAGIPVVAHVRNPLCQSMINKMLIRSADQIVTVCRFHERDVDSWKSGVPVVTCYDGVEVAEVNKNQATKVRHELLGRASFLIGSVGRLDQQKGYGDLICAAHHLAKVRTDFRVVIAGDGPLRTELQRLIRKSEVSDYIELCGFRSDVADFLGSLDVFVSSSYWEGLPLVVIEAMLLKIPVVVTDVCGNSELVVPDRTGTLAPVQDPQALAECIDRSLKSLSVDHRLEEAQELAIQLFAPDKSAESLNNIFRSVLSKQDRHIRTEKITACNHVH